MPHELTDLFIDENSLVDKGAHPDAKVLLYKAEALPEDIAKSEPAGADLHSGGSLEERVARRLKARENKKRTKSVTKDEDAGSVSNDSGVTSAEETKKMSKTETPELTPEAAEYVAKLEAYADDLEAKVAKYEGEEPEGDEADVEEVLKSADPAVQAIFTEVAKRAEEAERRLDEFAKREEQREDELLTAQYQSVAKSYRALPTGMNVEEMGEALKTIAKAAPEAFAKVKGVLDAADKALAENNYLTTEVGKSGGFDPHNSEGDRLEAEAREMVSKAGGDLSLAEARIAVLEANPDLYDRLNG